MKNIISKINRKLITGNEIRKVNKILRSGLLAQAGGGPAIKQFQSSFAKYFNRKYAFCTNSGTTALHTAISSLKLGNKDEVIIPALSNIADASVIIQEGAKPVFADVKKDTFCIDPDDVEKKITTNTRALIVVYMYGQPAEIEPLRMISKKYNLVLIEDCAQALGAKYNGEYVGTFGDLACFSFYQTKHITCGEGGMIIADNKNYAQFIDSLLDNGIKKDDLENYDYDKLGYNYQLTEIQAVIATGQLKRLEKLNMQRRRNAQIYRKRLEKNEIVFQTEEKGTVNVYFYLSGLLPEKFSLLRDEFIRRVRKKGVPIKKLYPIPLPKIELLKNYANNYSCPCAEDIAKRIFNLYVNPGFSAREINHFAGIINDVYRSL